MFQVRHGDVLLTKLEVDKVGIDISRPIPEKKGKDSKVTVALGEITGHSHTVHGDGAKKIDRPDAVSQISSGNQNNISYIDLPHGGYINHEEHGRIELEAGTYEVVRQTEWTRVGERRVAD